MYFEVDYRRSSACGQGIMTLSASYPTGNLGNDTINVGSTVAGATIFGGGGFLFDTSTDGADHHPRFSASSMIQANGSNDTIDITGSIIIPPFTAVKELITFWVDGTSTIPTLDLNLGADSLILNSTLPCTTRRSTVLILPLPIPELTPLLLEHVLFRPPLSMAVQVQTLDPRIRHSRSVH